MIGLRLTAIPSLMTTDNVIICLVLFLSVTAANLIFVLEAYTARFYRIELFFLSRIYLRESLTMSSEGYVTEMINITSSSEWTLDTGGLG